MEEDDAKPDQPKHGGSRPGRSANLPRNFAAGFNRLYKDYFSEAPVYGDTLFRRRFRMHRPLFLRIVEDVKAHDSYFVQKKDALGRPGLHPIQKITSAIRMLAYGGSAEANDEYLRIGESTSHKSLTQFLMQSSKFMALSTYDTQTKMISKESYRSTKSAGFLECSAR